MIRSLGDLHPRIAATAYVDESAQVIGDVVIGEHASIWMNVVVRGDICSIRIGDYTNIQDNCVLHVEENLYPLTLEDHVTVGHGVLLHGCHIERRCLIGMGAILLNGAQVGRHSIVAAGTLLVEGTTVPPRSLVMGSPGKVKRLLTDVEVAYIQELADRYVSYRLDYQ